MIHIDKVGVAAALLLMTVVQSASAQSGSLRVSEGGVSVSSSSASIAGKRYRASSGQSHEVILPDGTSVVIGAGGSFRVESFERPGADGRGVLRLSPGTYRISAGSLGRAGGLTVLAAATEIALQGATAVISIEGDQTVTTYMTVGGTVTVTTGPCARRLSRPGFSTQATAGGCPGRTARVAAARLSEDRRALRPARRVAAARSEDLGSSDRRGLLVPVAAETGEQPTQEATVGASETLTDRVNEQASGSVQFALTLAPGIGVPGAASPNVTGSSVTTTDGRFSIEDVGLVPMTDLPASTLEANGFAIGPPPFDEARGASFFFSNTDLRPVASAGSSTGDFGLDLRYVEVDDTLGLDASEQDDFVTVAQARAIEQSNSFSDVVDFYLDTVPADGGSFSFTTFDPATAGLTDQTLLGVERSTQFTPLPDDLTEFTRFARAPDDRRGMRFERADASLNIRSGADPQVFDGFVLFHMTDALNGAVDPTGQSEIYATGRVDNTSNAYFDFRVERYASSFGLFDLLGNGEDPWEGYQSKRALLPDRSRQPITDPASHIALNDTGIYFVYPEHGTNDPRGTIAQVVQADLGFQGAGAKQRSTVSIATGTVDRGSFGTSSQLDYALDLHSLGSLRDAPAGLGSILVSSPLATTAFGGHNENLIDSSGIGAGLAGYYLLVSDDAVAAGSVFRPVNPNARSAQFQTVRFLYGTGAVDANNNSLSPGAALAPSFQAPGFEPTARNQASTLVGYAAGLAEVQQPNNALAIAARGADGAPNFTLRTDPASSRLSARMTFARTSGAIEMGGLSDPSTAPLSAYVDQLRFAARTDVGADGLGFAMASAALVLGDPVESNGETSRPLLGLGSAEGTRVQDYQHVKWGIFLGDRIAVAGTNRREHIHIGSWVAGDPVDVSEYDTFTGTAIYSGHAIGNAFDGQSVYTAVGSFSNSWDFGAGTGRVDMGFDGTAYTGDTRLKSGGGFESTNLIAPDRTGVLDGDFFGGVSSVDGNRAPNALGGQFDITNTAGAPTYEATGTFAADKQ